MAKARAHVVFTGRVQGVGFRYTSSRLARSFEVTGWVRNMPDGTVELEAEGERSEVEAFVDAVSAQMGRYVSGADVSWVAPAGGEDGFRVRF